MERFFSTSTYCALLSVTVQFLLLLLMLIGLGWVFMSWWKTILDHDYCTRFLFPEMRTRRCAIRCKNCYDENSEIVTVAVAMAGCNEVLVP